MKAPFHLPGMELRYTLPKHIPTQLINHIRLLVVQIEVLEKHGVKTNVALGRKRIAFVAVETIAVTHFLAQLGDDAAAAGGALSIGADTHHAHVK